MKFLSQNTGVGSLSLLQGIFPTQGSNPGLLHCRWILYQMNYQGLQEERDTKEIKTHIQYTLPFPHTFLKTGFFGHASSCCFRDSSVGKESACNAGDHGSILGSGRSVGEGIGYPLQYSWASLVA